MTAGREMQGSCVTAPWAYEIVGAANVPFIEENYKILPSLQSYYRHAYSILSMIPDYERCSLLQGRAHPHLVHQQFQNHKEHVSTQGVTEGFYLSSTVGAPQHGASVLEPRRPSMKTLLCPKFITPDTIGIIRGHPFCPSYCFIKRERQAAILRG